MTLGQQIASARREKGMTQEMLAEKLGVTRQAVARWETGLSVPDAGMLVRIAGALDTTVNDLLGEEEPEQGRGTWPPSWKRSTGSWPSGRNAAAGAGGPSLRRWESWPCGGP